jgi:hypothetical protein
MFDSELFEGLKETTKNWSSGADKKKINETETSAGEYTKSPIDGAKMTDLEKIVHQADTYKTQAGWPDNYHEALKGATLKQSVGTINPGNIDNQEKVATDAQKQDDAQVKAEMGRDVKAVKDEEKFLPEMTSAGNPNPGNSESDRETNKELAKDNDTNSKTMKAELANDKDILAKTGPSTGPTKK